MSAGHLCRDRTEVLTERAQKTALLRRKRLHRFDCGGSAKSASGLCVRLLNVVLHTHSWRSPGAVTSSATFAVRSRRPEACHVRTQTNDYHCAQRTTVSALHRRRNQIGRRFERSERACKTTGSRRVQRPLADFAEPLQSKRCNLLRRNSAVFCTRSGRTSVRSRRSALRTLLAPPFGDKRW